MWLPFIKKLTKTKFHFFLALTIGLLLFLGIDSIEESFEVSQEHLSDNFNGTMLIFTVVLLSFFGLYYSSEKITNNTASLRFSKYFAIALMISIGIGLHNFGEGLAIEAAVGMGSIAFSTFLIVGFALHNTTEGIAIASSLSRESLSSSN